MSDIGSPTSKDNEIEKKGMPKESGNLDEHVAMGIIVKVRRRVCGINRSSVEDYTDPVQGKQGSDIGGTRSSIITACQA